ncbi:TauD/TfdA family dioxygenase [Streptomyces sp. NBC_00091]|uniref:TauD/TfdA family dioxygenase n=1 Tax=Streptomyces sp. NBC_00091 TaxID=2975648 RepID=UPI002256C7A9|nr:TauD/TfdA family dioxygenase [Streptomyces sp. NBC_00091]MCX5380993.1 TauD/TfdA family dioxygenase [Streptomyces sp. NBC_00091]
MTTLSLSRTAPLSLRVTPGAPTRVAARPAAGLEQTCHWLSASRGALRAALAESGALLLRGLPLHDPADFARIRDALFTERTAYREKATPRSDFGDDVFSSTDLPSAQPIRPHNENSYTLTFPGRLLFGCLIAPEQGGATPVTDVRQVLRNLPEDLVRRFRATGWRLTRSYSDHLSVDWRTAFATDSRDEVERYCAANRISCSWQPDGTLRTAQVRPAVIRHPHTGEEVWFNHAAFWNQWALDAELRQVLLDELGPDGLPFDTSFGDGTPLTEEQVAAIDRAYDAATVREDWRPGDVLLVDNLLTAHGREAYRGERRILVAMGDPVALSDCRPSTESAGFPS